MSAHTWADLNLRLEALQAVGAQVLAPAQWHHLQVLRTRSLDQTPTVQALLLDKAQDLLKELETTSVSAQTHVPVEKTPDNTPSPLAQLVEEMQVRGATGQSPRVQQFRQDLRHISVQKKVRTALSRAPQNAGPINSHMLVLRGLELMRSLSPQYLQRFVGYVDTLALLEGLTPALAAPKKATPRKKKLA
jgi:Protein of unknown function (DUF2894)